MYILCEHKLSVFILSPPVEVEEYNKESSLHYYQRVFEAPFLAETREYYLHVASKLVCVYARVNMSSCHECIVQAEAVNFLFY